MQGHLLAIGTSFERSPSPAPSGFRAAMVPKRVGFGEIRIAQPIANGGLCFFLRFAFGELRIAQPYRKAR